MTQEGMEADDPQTGEGNYTFTIANEDQGARLDKWLSERLEGLTRTRLKALIEEGALARNGVAFTDPSYKLREGDEILLTLPDLAPPTPKGEDIPLEIAYEDDAVIVINKPAGMVVHPAAGNWTGTLVNALIAHCGDSLSGIGGVARPGIIHRIDKDTSGLLAVAKHDAAHQAMTSAFAAHDVERVYEALTIGAPRPGVGTIDKPIGRANADRKKFAAYDENSERADLRHAVTHYKTLSVFGRARAKLAGDALAASIECRLETGRTHQIRVHMSALGCPLIGDPLYGRGPGLAGLKPGDEMADKTLKILKKFRRQALHARTLGFDHPISGQSLSFTAEPPEDYARLKSALEAI